MASKTRDARIIAAVACPQCGACVGEHCRNPIPHQQSRGAVDRRAQPMHPHRERRDVWVRTKTLGEAKMGLALALPIKTLEAMPELSLAECDTLILAVEYYRDALEAAQETFWAEPEALRFGEAKMGLALALPIKTLEAMPELSLAECDTLILAVEYYQDALDAANAA